MTEKPDVDAATGGFLGLQKRLLRPDEVAAIFDVSRWTIYRWIHEGRLEAAKIGNGTIRVLKDSVEKLVGNRV